jgi:hypothetical protein
VADLKLQKLPDRMPVKVSIMLSAELNRELHDYAEAYTMTCGSSESVAELIPFMLATFIAGDGSYKKLKSGVRPSG